MIKDGTLIDKGFKLYYQWYLTKQQKQVLQKEQIWKEEGEQAPKSQQ